MANALELKDVVLAVLNLVLAFVSGGLKELCRRREICTGKGPKAHVSVSGKTKVYVILGNAGTSDFDPALLGRLNIRCRFRHIFHHKNCSKMISLDSIFKLNHLKVKVSYTQKNSSVDFLSLPQNPN
jgi:hypothetical protein